MSALTSPYAFLNDLIGKKVALIDRGFIVTEGRVVYPTTVGKMTGATDKAVFLELSEGEQPAAFLLDALRCVREVTEQAAPAATQEAPQ